jgi:hypothetical protein
VFSLIHDESRRIKDNAQLSVLFYWLGRDNLHLSQGLSHYWVKCVCRILFGPFKEPQLKYWSQNQSDWGPHNIRRI